MDGKSSGFVACDLRLQRYRLVIRAYSVVKTPNEVLVDKLGLDIPPAPIITLEEISFKEIQISWKQTDPQNSVHAYVVELNGKAIGQTKKTEASATIHNLLPGTFYDVRVFTISATRFQTPSQVLHVRTSTSTQEASSEDSNDGQPHLTAYATKVPSLQTAPSATLMVRETSGGQPGARRGTVGRRVSPIHPVSEVLSGQADDNARTVEDEINGDLAQLSERFQKAQQEDDSVEAQIVDAEKEFEVQSQQLERHREELRRSLKERDELSNDLKKQVHKLETANRTAQSEKNKKERLLQQKEGQRKKRREEVARWDDQISSMKDEMAGIETQKAAIEKRAQSDLAEIRRKMDEEQRDITLLEEENKEKALHIQALEEERKQLNAENETEESREADRAELEREAKWREKLNSLGQTYSNLWQHLVFAREQYRLAQDRLAFLESTRRAATASFTSMALDVEAVRRVPKPIRRPRHGSSLASSISSPRAGFPPEIYTSVPYLSGPTASPTALGPLFNMANGTTMRVPEESITPPLEEPEIPEGVPMSPRADALLPADLLGDESADELPEEEADEEKKTSIPALGSFSTMPPPALPENGKQSGSPSPVSSSNRSFSSPHESFFDNDQRSIDSSQQAKDSAFTAAQQGSRKLMSNLFSFNRQRGKTVADQPPLLGSLKTGQSQSFPRNLGDEFDPVSQRRRRLLYGGTWAFPGNFLPRPSGNEDQSHPPTTRRAFPSIFGLGKTTSSTPGFDPFTARTNSFDANIRIDNSSPRPSSTYSFDNFDKLPRPSLESQFLAWAPERAALRGSPLAPDWASTHSFSRNPSRRASVQQGSTSNLSLVARGDQDFLDSSSRATQAPIGTRPTSSQRPATPKLNPAAPSFTTLFSKRTDKSKDKAKLKELSKDKVNDAPDESSPPDSRKSKETPSITATTSTLESRESLERLNSGQSGAASQEITPLKPTFISKITRKASSNKFGSWKDKGGLFSRKEQSTPTGELEEGDASSATEQLGKSLESTSTTPSAEDKKAASRTSLSWSFMRKSKKGATGREDLTASEVSESSERASEAGDDDGDHEG